jgi:hypothetical protein
MLNENMIKITKTKYMLKFRDEIKKIDIKLSLLKFTFI